MRRLRSYLAGPVLVCVAAIGVFGASAPADADSTTANGQGSTYVGIAMQQWISQAQEQAIPVNYTATNSPAGLNAFAQNVADFAGTEAEFSSLGESDNVSRGWQYTPDVAGATAIMYNVDTQAGQPVTYLHLSPMTIAEIFMGQISNWDSPAITADNHGLQLPNEPITVVYRTGQSGTTALFYDFVHQTDPSYYTQWAQACQYPTYPTRIIDLDNCSSFVPHEVGFSGSDQQAEYVASAQGLWSIGYDEFAYPKQYGAQVAWVENASGNWVQPYATNIAAALQSATLNADLSQNLDNVYTSTNPLTYPISAYSYIVTQCAGTSAWPSCKGAYSNSGLSQTLGDFMSYIACGGQVDMAALGYSPLPSVLAQDMMNAVARLTGAASPEQVSASNCADPTFSGSLGAEATNPNPDPYLGCSANAFAPGGGGCAGQSAPTTTTTTVATTTTTAPTTTTGTSLATTSTSSSIGGKTPTSASPTTAPGSAGTPGTTGSGTGTTVAGSRTGTTVAGGQPGSAATPSSWLPTSALGSPVSAAMNSSGLHISASYNGAAASVSVPAGALPVGTTVALYPVSSPSVLAHDVPALQSYVTSFAVLWGAPGESAPALKAPATITITDASIAAGASVSDLTTSGLSVLGTIPSAGGIALRFSGVSLFVISQVGGPAATPTTTRPAGGAGPSTPTTGSSTGARSSTATTSTVTQPGAKAASPTATTSSPTATTRSPAVAAASGTGTAGRPTSGSRTATTSGAPVQPGATTASTPTTALGQPPATAGLSVGATTSVATSAPVSSPGLIVAPAGQPTTTGGASAVVGTVAGASGLQATSTTGDFRSAAPVAYNRPVVGGISADPLVVLLCLLLLPALVGGIRVARRTSRPRRADGSGLDHISGSV